MRVLLARTSCDTSLTILPFSFGDRVVNHFARRFQVVSFEEGDDDTKKGARTTLPCRESRIRYLSSRWWSRLAGECRQTAKAEAQRT